MLKRKLKYFKVLIIIFILTISFLGVIPFVFADIILVDSYIEENWVNSLAMIDYHPSDTTGSSAIGQSFMNSDTAKKIISVKFYLSKNNVPTGLAHAVLYAHSGTYGESSLPTGSALATSDDFNVEDLGGSEALVTFTFTGAEQYEIQIDTYYCIAYENPSSGTINSIDYSKGGYDNTSPSHNGNMFHYKDGGWLQYGDTIDTIFYVYGEEVIGDEFPFYSDVGYDSVTQVGESADFWVFWEDDFTLDTCYFSTNNTGSWVNSSISVSGVSSWANITLPYLNYTSSIQVEYMWYCSDNASQWNWTSTYSLITTSLYITFNFNNSTMGKFYVDYVNTVNETQNSYNYNESILLDGIQLSSDYSFLNFTWISGNSLINNYEYYTSGNNTIWCYFGLSSVGGIDESYFVLGFVIAGCAILFIIIVLKSDKKEK